MNPDILHIASIVLSGGTLLFMARLTFQAGRLIERFEAMEKTLQDHAARLARLESGAD